MNDRTTMTNSGAGVLSAMSANSLFWLGRYVQRVYMTLHTMRYSYDTLIDAGATACQTFCQHIDSSLPAYTIQDLMSHLVYDEDNPASLISAQIRARDNAMLLREIILSESLSYLEMGVALMKRNAAAKDYRMDQLQPITDWSLAFFGSIIQRIYNPPVVALIQMGRSVENLDMMLRFDYSVYKLRGTFDLLKLWSSVIPDTVDEHILAEIETILTQATERHLSDADRLKLMSLDNVLVRV